MILEQRKEHVRSIQCVEYETKLPVWQNSYSSKTNDIDPI